MLVQYHFLDTDTSMFIFIWVLANVSEKKVYFHEQKTISNQVFPKN